MNILHEKYKFAKNGFYSKANNIAPFIIIIIKHIFLVELQEQQASTPVFNLMKRVSFISCFDTKKNCNEIELIYRCLTSFTNF